MINEKRKRIIRMKVNVFKKIDDVLNIIEKWILLGGGQYVCVSNVHMCMEAYKDREFESIVNSAGLVIADGRPIVWGQRILGAKNAIQIRGMDLMLELCTFAQKQGFSVGFFGSSEKVLQNLCERLKDRFPDLLIDFQMSPPFRELEASEEDGIVEMINFSNIDLLFVGLGCPKQEKWMSRMRDRVDCVLVGVGAAFDFVAGTKKAAPKFMNKLGLEWFFRLFCEPRRLWRRYLLNNPMFIFLFIKQFFFENKVK
jgi:N-acetylglucosaminyldiphosphoundecaprenol N-acetyl-beta-D-mannosaminyltransferase